jgi:hypothetical protein
MKFQAEWIRFYLDTLIKKHYTSVLAIEALAEFAKFYITCFGG